MQLCDLTVHELKNLLAKREASAAEIVDSCLERIAKVEGDVGAFITRLDDTARSHALAIDNKGDYEGLAGIPYALKDNFCTREVRTTCASQMLNNFVPFYDATAARLLADAGGILLGKLNMDEFALGCSTEHSAFFPTKNPWDHSRVPGGSSGGCAAAVASGEIPFSLGTDTGGSIRQPASFCGLVGLKPTYGRVSRWGVIACASSFDSVGPLTRDVADCAFVMGFIAQPDRLDSNSSNRPGPDYMEYLKPQIKGLKIAYPSEYFQDGVDDRVKTVVLKALQTYERMGAVVEEVSLPTSAYALAAYILISAAEISTNLAKYDGVRFGLRDYEAENVTEMFSKSRGKGFGEEVKRRILLGTYSLSSSQYETRYLKALQLRRLIKEDFDRVLADFDVIATPTTPGIAFRLGEDSDPMTSYRHNRLTAPVNMAGLPAISIPCGFVDDMPVGMQLIGKPFGEATIINTAYAFEQATDFRLAKPGLGVK